MFLGFLDNIMDIINVPLGLILQGIYWLLGNYGWSIIVFAILAKAAMLPSAIKTQKNQLRMQKIQPKMKRLAEKYQNDKKNPKYQEELQALYSNEGYNPMSGCLPQLIQFPVIFGLWNVIRQPLTYICNFSDSNLYKSVKVLVESASNTEAVNNLRNIFTKAEFFADGKLAEYSKDLQKVLDVNEIYIADAINNNGGVDGLNEALNGTKKIIETEFFGINLGDSAANHGILSWFIIIPIIAAASSFLISFISSRMNKAQTDKSDPTAKSMNIMMYTMPLLSLWIGYSMNIGVAIYWISTNLLSLLQVILLHKLVKAPAEAPPPKKEKKLNYTQIKKMEEQAKLNGETIDIDKKQ